MTFIVFYCSQALDGFLFVVNSQGKVVFASDNISKLLKYVPVSKANGRYSIYSLIQPCIHVCIIVIQLCVQKVTVIIQSLTTPLIHSLIQSLIQLLIHSHSHLFTHSYSHSYSRSFTHSPSHSYTNIVSHLHTHSFTHSHSHLFT